MVERRSGDRGQFRVSTEPPQTVLGAGGAGEEADNSRVCFHATKKAGRKKEAFCTKWSIFC